MKKKHVKKIYKQIIDPDTNEAHLQSFYEELPEKDHQEEGNRFLEQSKKMIKKKDKINATDELIANDEQEEAASRKVTLLKNSRADSEKKGKGIW